MSASSRSFSAAQTIIAEVGLLFMCVPDARATFDRLRQLTPTEHILAEHRAGPAAILANRKPHYVDWVVHVELSGILGDLRRPVAAGTEEELVQRLLDMEPAPAHAGQAPAGRELEPERERDGESHPCWARPDSCPTTNRTIALRSSAGKSGPSERGGLPSRC
jgi:hypothetical protein